MEVKVILIELKKDVQSLKESNLEVRDYTAVLNGVRLRNESNMGETNFKNTRCGTLNSGDLENCQFDIEKAQSDVK